MSDLAIVLTIASQAWIGGNIEVTATGSAAAVVDAVTKSGTNTLYVSV